MSVYPWPAALNSGECPQESWSLARFGPGRGVSARAVRPPGRTRPSCCSSLLSRSGIRSAADPGLPWTFARETRPRAAVCIHPTGPDPVRPPCPAAGPSFPGCVLPRPRGGDGCPVRPRRLSTRGKPRTTPGLLQGCRAGPLRRHVRPRAARCTWTRWRPSGVRRSRRIRGPWPDRAAARDNPVPMPTRGPRRVRATGGPPPCALPGRRSAGADSTPSCSWPDRDPPATAT